MITRLKVSGFKNLVDLDVSFGPFTAFNIPRAIHAVAEFTEDFSPLLRLPAFRQLKQELSSALAGILPQPPRAGA